MPKSIIREYDNSSATATLTSDFAVVVPGYASDEGDTEALRTEAQKAGIYVDGVYILNSTAQFKYYIGKFAGQHEEAKAPTLEVLNPTEPEGAVSSFRKILSVADFEDYTAASDYQYYEGFVLRTTDAGYGKNGKLLKTFETTSTTNGVTSTIKETYVFEPVTQAQLYQKLNTAVGTTTPYSYFKIKKGNEGVSLVKETHQGNQIAWELLKLGYIVLYKTLSKEDSALNQLKNADFWEQFKNKSTFNFRYLISGGVFTDNAEESEVYARMAEIAGFNNSVKIEEADTYGNACGRGDCIALIDINEHTDFTYTDPSTGEEIVYKPADEAQKPVELLTRVGAAANLACSAMPAYALKNVAIFAPKVTYDMTPDSDYNKVTTFPASFHYLACAIASQQRFAEWYAVAGYTRGISSRPIRYTSLTFGEILINTLAPRVLTPKNNPYTKHAINLILSERGSYYLWGNRTAEPLDNDGLRFSHFLNIRQLCSTLKQIIYQASRTFTFDPNSDLLWVNFVNAIKPTLNGMQADQGIKAFMISRVATDQKALLKAKIRIVPIEALEDFDISIHLEDSLSGIIVQADEEVAE